MTRFQGFVWHACRSETLPRGEVIYTLYVNGVCEAHGGQEHGEPWRGRPIGRVWNFDGRGWAASPARLDGLPDTWGDEISRSERNFRTKAEACAWLHGFDRAVRMLTRGMIPMTSGAADVRPCLRIDDHTRHYWPDIAKGGVYHCPGLPAAAFRDPMATARPAGWTAGT